MTRRLFSHDIGKELSPGIRLAAVLACENWKLGALAWSPDGTRLAAAFGEDGHAQGIAFWDVDRPVPLRTISGAYLSSVSWSPDGTFVAATSNGQVVVWNSTDDQTLRPY